MSVAKAMAELLAALQRRHVPPNHSCLFTSFAYLCEDLDAENDAALRSASRRLREVCAAAVKADPEPDTRAALLGVESVDAYAAWIANDHHWGGEPELLMLAEHFNVAVSLASCETNRLLHYAPASGEPPNRIWLLYTGQHYDPLVGADGARRLDAGADEARGAAALEIAAQHTAEAARRAAEKRVKKLKCGGCGALLADGIAFQAHCAEVEHDDDFG